MTEGFVETNGVALWYQRHGQAGGVPVVLIHGVEAASIWWPPELVDSLVAAGHEVASGSATGGPFVSRLHAVRR